MQTVTETSTQKNIHAILQPRRLRHITGICLRNLTVSDINSLLKIDSNERSKDAVLRKLFFRIIDEHTSDVIFESHRIDLCTNPGWLNFEIQKTHQSTSNVLHLHLFLDDPTTGKSEMLLKWRLDLSRLSYIAERLYHGEISFSPNALVIQVNGSFYSPSQCFSTDTPHGNCPHFNLDEEKGSCNLLSLKRMITCHRSISRAKHRTSEYLRTAELLMQQKELHLQKVRQLEDLQKRVKRMKLLLLRETTMLESERRDLNSLEYEAKNKDENLCKKRTNVLQERDRFNELTDQLVLYRQRTGILNGQLTARHIEVLSELAYIFPINSFTIQITGKNANSGKNQSQKTPKQTVGFKICDIYLPEAESLVVKDDSKNAVAMGYVSQMLYMISYFLLIPLRFPLMLQGSQSSIVDNVLDKIQVKDRLFPLYSKSNKERFLFEYAIYLVNKNIGQMRFLLGLPKSDLRLTLYNLKSLLDHTSGGHDRTMVIRKTSLVPEKTPVQKSPQLQRKDDIPQVKEVEMNGVKATLIDLEDKVLDKSMELNSMRGELFGSKKGIPASPRRVSPNVIRKSQNSPSKTARDITSTIASKIQREDVSIIITETGDAAPVLLTGLEDLDQSPKNSAKSQKSVDVAAARSELFKTKSGRPVITKKQTFSMRQASGSQSDNYFSTKEQYFKNDTDKNDGSNNTDQHNVSNGVSELKNDTPNIENNNLKTGYAPLAIEEDLDLC